jgi:flagellar hook-basal body complex protein FliE
MAGPTIPLGPAAAAYAKALDRPQAAVRGDGSPLPSFGAMLEQTMSDAIAAGHRGEAAATEAAAGKASLQAVVEAVNAAELSLQTVVAVRDRMIAAYQEILRMPI